jgi:hypothetical protein
MLYSDVSISGISSGFTTESISEEFDIENAVYTTFVKKTTAFKICSSIMEEMADPLLVNIAGISCSSAR